MTDKHDEALVERVALALVNCERKALNEVPLANLDHMPWARRHYGEIARAAIHPPKTRLEVAWELLGKEGFSVATDPMGAKTAAAMRAVLAALAMDKMED